MGRVKVWWGCNLEPSEKTDFGPADASAHNSLKLTFDGHNFSVQQGFRNVRGCPIGLSTIGIENTKLFFARTTIATP
tara:strand:+ start:27939 stop:28169 length:231 start_codon:yes stop_codon:yes gene_type:complete